MDSDRSSSSSSRSQGTREQPEVPGSSGECKLIDSILSSEPDVLAQDDEELAMIYAHQMNTPLAVDLGPTVLPLLQLADSNQPQRLGQTQTQAPLVTFGDILTHPAPPLELLKWGKHFAKDHRTGRLRGLPKEIATVLYFVNLVVAELRCQHSITNLSRTEFLQGIRWILTQSWIDDPTRELFQQAYNQLGGESDPNARSRSGPPKQSEVRR